MLLIIFFFLGTWRCDPCKGLALPSREKSHLNKMAASVKERYKKQSMKLHAGRRVKGLVHFLKFVANLLGFVFYCHHILKND